MADVTSDDVVHLARSDKRPSSCRLSFIRNQCWISDWVLIHYSGTALYCQCIRIP
jgi:hypothetical protein